MPKRTTPFQMIVHAIRAQLAGPGTVVTESKYLRDTHTGGEREVDVVIEGDFEGEQLVMSIEVVEHRRRADITWVEQQIRKHLYLPTNLLILVSQSGFSKNALVAVEKEGGSVQAVAPEIVTVDGIPVVKRLFADRILVTPTSYSLIVSESPQTLVLPGEPEFDILREDGEFIGSLGRLVHELMSLDHLLDRYAQEAHNHPERDNLSHFSCGFDLSPFGYCVRAVETDRLFTILAIDITGTFKWEQHEVPLQLSRLGNQRYVAAEMDSFGQPTIWAGTSNVAAGTSLITRREIKPSKVKHPTGERKFPEVQTLAIPDHLHKDAGTGSSALKAAYGVADESAA